MKEIELKKASGGRYRLNDIKIEEHEEETIKLLVLYGFNIEVVRPVNTPGMNNPDIFMSGTVWEIKSPISYNEGKLKNRMKKAAKQAGRVVFDFRNMKIDHDRAEEYVRRLFVGNNNIRRMILITKDGKVLDFLK